MSKPQFFSRERGLTVAEIASLTGAEPRAGAALDRRIVNIAPLERAGPSDLAFCDGVRFAEALRASRAGACFVQAEAGAHAPAHVAVLQAKAPYRAFVMAARALFPEAVRPSSLFAVGERAGGADAASGAGHFGAFVHPEARLEEDVVIEPGAVIGPRAEIGSGTIIGPTAVIGADVRIGRDGMVGAGATVTHALIGDRVIIHPGCRIGQDGFGYLPGPGGHTKIPQVGRVIIQDDVEIGAGSTIDRGAMGDTVVGEGTKIDNLVQVGHNVWIGRNCIIVAQCGISGSVTLEDWVVLGGQVGIADHITIGEGAQVGASSGVMNDIPAGAKWFGTPAKPGREMFRELAMLKRMSAPGGRRAPRSAEPGTDA